MISQLFPADGTNSVQLFLARQQDSRYVSIRLKFGRVIGAKHRQGNEYNEIEIEPFWVGGN